MMRPYAKVEKSSAIHEPHLQESPPERVLLKRQIEHRACSSETKKVHQKCCRVQRYTNLLLK